MLKVIVIASAAFLLGGCAGWTSAVMIHMEYMTPEAAPIAPAAPASAPKKPAAWV